MNDTYLVSDLLYDNINLDQIEAIQKSYEMEQELKYLYDIDTPLISDILTYEDLEFLKAMGL